MKEGSPWVGVGIYGGAGFTLAATVVAGAFLGHVLDMRWNLNPGLTVAGVLVGFVGGIYNVFRILKWYEARTSTEERKKP